jgi:hypothetical protein
MTWCLQLNGYAGYKMTVKNFQHVQCFLLYPLCFVRITYVWTYIILITQSEIIIQSDLGSRTPRVMNNSVYEQIFRIQSVSDDVLCLELRTRKPSTSWSDKLGVSASAVFVEE